MTMTITRPTRRTNGHAASAAQRLRQTFAAVRVSFTWMGVRKTLTTSQKEQAAESFGAEGQFLSAAKKLLDTHHPAFQAVSAVRGHIQNYWRELSLPYPEPGVRLIKQDEIEGFNTRMEQFRGELTQAVVALDLQYATLRSTAQERLGSLYNPADYPRSLRGLFEVGWDFPSVEPPEYLLRLNPALYQQERERITSRFNEAVQMAEQAFVAELGKLVDHLVERLSAGPEGEHKVFRDTAITNLSEFFTRFRSLNVGSSAELDRLVETAQRVIQGVDPQAVRDSEGLRQHVATQFAGVAATLDQLLVDQPRRRILPLGPCGDGVMELVITPSGIVRAIYSEEIPLETLGPPHIVRASTVEPTPEGEWLADLAAVGGPRLGPYARRSDALRAEVEWLTQRWLSA